jgi:hypothetical protein
VANRGKKRRRATGELAVSRRDPVRSAPLMLKFSEEPLDPVSPDQLAQALAISNRHVPIGSDAEDDAAEDGAFELIFEEMESLFGDEALTRQIDSRLYLLREFLGRRGPSHFTVEDDGRVTISAGLLEFAAAGPLSGHPDEKIEWSPEMVGSGAR